MSVRDRKMLHRESARDKECCSAEAFETKEDKCDKECCNAEAAETKEDKCDKGCCSAEAAETKEDKCDKECCNAEAFETKEDKCDKGCCSAEAFETKEDKCDKECCTASDTSTAAKPKRVISSAQVTDLLQKVPSPKVKCCTKCLLGGSCCATACCELVCCVMKLWEETCGPQAVAQLEIWNMDCGECAVTGEKAIAALDGVFSVHISSVLRTGQVKFDPSRVSEARFAEVLTSLGFPSSVRSVHVSETNRDRVSTLNLVAELAEHVLPQQIPLAFHGKPGVKSCRVSLKKATSVIISIEYDASIVGARDLFRQAASLDYLSHTALASNNQNWSGEGRELRAQQLRLVVATVLALPIFIISFIIPLTQGEARDAMESEVAPGFTAASLASWILCTPIQWIIGSPLFVSAYRAARYGKTVNMDTLVVLSTSVGYLYSTIAALSAFSGTEITDEYFFEASALLLTIIVLGRYLETAAQGKTADVLSSVMNLQPSFATLENDQINGTEEIDTRLLHHGDIILVKPGFSIPTDGIIVGGDTSVDESMLTGESTPVRKTALSPQQGLITNENRVFGGTVNHSGLIRIRVEYTVSENALSSICRLVQEAQLSKPPIQKFADQIAAMFVPVVLVLSASSLVVWVILAETELVSHSGSTLSFALKFALSTLVVSCPCAIGLAVPTVLAVASSLGAKNGVLFGNAAVIEQLRQVTAIAFDKTGTLTMGKPTVTAFKVFESKNLSLDLFWLLIGSSESGSEHPLGRAISQHARDACKQDLHPPDNLVAVPGKGIKCSVDCRQVLMGTREFLEENKADTQVLQSFALEITQTENQGCTVVLVAIDGETVGFVALRDPPRPEAAEVVARLQQRNIQVWMLSGDSQAAARSVARELGIDPSCVFGRVSPADKASRVKLLQNQSKIVALVGDGINDGPALAQANVGVAMGMGTDVALAAADIVLLKNCLRDLLFAINVSSAAFQRIKINFMWAFVYNAVAITIAMGFFYPLGGLYIPPALAGLSELLSSLPIVASSLLLRRYHDH